MKKGLKILFVLLIIPVLAVGCGCDKDEQQDRTEFQIKQPEEVKDDVKGWVVFTNPAFQYELRSPKDWEIKDVDKKGEEVMFYPKGEEISDTYKGELRILGFSNWQDNLAIEKFVMSKAPINYYDLGFDEKIDFNFRDYVAVQLKGVKLDEENTIDVIAVRTKSHIVLIEMRGSYDELTNIIGSMYFY